MKTLEDAHIICSTESGARVSGIIHQSENPATVLCLLRAQYVLESLETLKRAWHSTMMTVAEMLEAAKTVKLQYLSMKKEYCFGQIFQKFSPL